MKSTLMVLGAAAALGVAHTTKPAIDTAPEALWAEAEFGVAKQNPDNEFDTSVFPFPGGSTGGGTAPSAGPTTGTQPVVNSDDLKEWLLKNSDADRAPKPSKPRDTGVIGGGSPRPVSPVLP